VPGLLALKRKTTSSPGATLVKAPPLEGLERVKQILVAPPFLPKHQQRYSGKSRIIEMEMIIGRSSVFYADRKSKMAATTGHSINTEPYGENTEIYSSLKLLH
jgi:hypothetical protein